MTELHHRLEAGEVLILDGGTGTEIEKRGVPMDDASWCAAALETHPEVVRRVHEDYIRAGAEVIITNTYTTSRHVLEEAGFGDRFRELNARAVELACQARGNVAEGPVYVAGSMSTFPPRLDPAYNPSPERARENYREQAEVFAEAGADLIAIELVRDIDQTSHALLAALQTGLPVWIGFSCKRYRDGNLLLWEGSDTLADALTELAPLGASLVAIMHTLTEDTVDALTEVREHWEGPMGAYPHSGRFVMPHWQFTDVISPEDFAAEARRWTVAGAQAIGGCCGIGPDHIRLLKESLPTRL